LLLQDKITTSTLERTKKVIAMSHYLRGYVLVDAKGVQVHVLYSSLSKKIMHEFKHGMVNIR
jgi:hypothetical protein